jgi:predicted dehydrogenase
MTASFKLAVIGCGEKNWELRTRALKALAADGVVEVLAVSDPDLGRAEMVADALGAPPAFESLDDVIKHERLDGVVVMLPAQTQCVGTTDALERGLHVFCEAPFGHSAKEAQQMIEKAWDANRVLAAGYHYRHQAAWSLWHAQLGGIGARWVLDANWLRSTGTADLDLPAGRGFWDDTSLRDIFADRGIHHLLSVGLPMLGSRPVAVTAVRWNDPHWDEADLRIMDEFSVAVDLASGARGRFTAARGVDALAERFDVRCYGTKGQMRVPLMAAAGLDGEKFRPSVIGRGGGLEWGEAPGALEEVFVAELLDWVQACRGDRPLPRTKDFVLLHKVLDGAYESVKRGGERIEI